MLTGRIGNDLFWRVSEKGLLDVMQRGAEIGRSSELTISEQMKGALAGAANRLVDWADHSKRKVALGLAALMATSGVAACGPNTEAAPVITTTATTPESVPSASSEPETSSTDSPEPVETLANMETGNMGGERFTLYDWSGIDREAFAGWDEMIPLERDKLAIATLQQYDPEIHLVNQNEAPSSEELVENYDRTVKIVQDMYNDGEDETALKLVEFMEGYGHEEVANKNTLEDSVRNLGDVPLSDPEFFSDPSVQPYFARSSSSTILYGGPNAIFSQEEKMKFTGRKVIKFNEDISGGNVPRELLMESVVFYYDNKGTKHSAGNDATKRQLPVWRVLSVRTGLLEAVTNAPYSVDFGDGLGEQVLIDMAEITEMLEEQQGK